MMPLFSFFDRACSIFLWNDNNFVHLKFDEIINFLIILSRSDGWLMILRCTSALNESIKIRFFHNLLRYSNYLISNNVFVFKFYVTLLASLYPAPCVLSLAEIEWQLCLRWLVLFRVFALTLSVNPTSSLYYIIHWFMHITFIISIILVDTQRKFTHFSFGVQNLEQRLQTFTLKPTLDPFV